MRHIMTASSSSEELAREWIGERLPDCPFCTAPAPWMISERVYSGEDPRTSFRCVRCNGVLTTATAAIMSPDYDRTVRLVVDNVGMAKHSYRLGTAHHPGAMSQEAHRRIESVVKYDNMDEFESYIRNERVNRNMDAKRREDIRGGMGAIVAGLGLSMLTSLWSATMPAAEALSLAPVIAGLGALWSLLVLGGAAYIWWQI